MIRRRAPLPPSAPVPEWRRRFDAAAASLRSQGTPSWLDDRIDELESALDDAAADDARLAAAIAQLDPQTTARNLKAALRSQQLGDVRSSFDFERGIATLRQRHETVNQLMNRRDALAAKIDAAVADLEILVIRNIGSSALSPRGAFEPVDDRLDRLRDDIRALELARAELMALDEPRATPPTQEPR